VLQQVIPSLRLLLLLEAVHCSAVELCYTDGCFYYCVHPRLLASVFFFFFKGIFPKLFCGDTFMQTVSHDCIHLLTSKALWCHISIISLAGQWPDWTMWLPSTAENTTPFPQGLRYKCDWSSYCTWISILMGSSLPRAWRRVCASVRGRGPSHAASASRLETAGCVVCFPEMSSNPPLILGSPAGSLLLERHHTEHMTLLIRGV